MSCNITVKKFLCGAKIINLAHSFRFLRFSVAVIQCLLNVTTFYSLVMESLWVKTSSVMTIIVPLVEWFLFLGENESGPQFRRNKIWRLNRPSFHFPRIEEGQFEFVGNAIPSPFLSSPSFFCFFLSKLLKLTVHHRQQQ